MKCNLIFSGYHGEIFRIGLQLPYSPDIASSDFFDALAKSYASRKEIVIEYGGHHFLISIFWDIDANMNK